MAAPISVIETQYCAPRGMELAIVKKAMSFADNFTVTDVNGELIFKVKQSPWSLHGHRVLVNAAGNPIVTLRLKIMTTRNRWKVFRGESSEDHDLIFSVRRTSVIEFKKELDVFLTNNATENVCDFKVKGSCSESSWVVYAGESNVNLAEMQMKQTGESEKHFNVKVNQNVDYAFIVALIVILDEINDNAKKAEKVLSRMTSK